MIKAGIFFRSAIVENLKKEMSKSDSLFVIQYSGLSSLQMTNLRTSLKNSRSRLLVTKSSLIRRAFEDSKIERMDSLLEGQAGLVLGYEDLADTSKALTKFAKENKNLVLKGAFFHNRILNKEDIENISQLPSKETLRAQLVMALKSPLAGLVFTLKANLNKLVVVLGQIKDKKK